MTIRRLGRNDILSGLLLSAAIATVVVTAMFAGMAATGLYGGIELVASLLFFLTLPAGALALSRD
jgi:hypothetical protein